MTCSQMTHDPPGCNTRWQHWRAGNNSLRVLQTSQYLQCPKVLAARINDKVRLNIFDKNMYCIKFKDGANVIYVRSYRNVIVSCVILIGWN